MSAEGQFDPLLVDQAWFDPTNQVEGWFDPILIAASAGALSASLAEAGSASEAATPTLSALVSHSESATAAETVSGALATTAAATESASAADSPAGNLTIPASESAAASATDTPAALQSAVVSLVDSASAGDSPAGGLLFTASHTEPASAADTCDAELFPAGTLPQAVDQSGGFWWKPADLGIITRVEVCGVLEHTTESRVTSIRDESVELSLLVAALSEEM